MEGTQVEQLLGFLNVYGPFRGRLTYNVQIDPTAKTYSESLVEGSTYNGLPIQLTIGGAFDGAIGQWNSTTSGAIGGATFVGSGTDVFTDPPGKADEESIFFEKWKDSKGRFHHYRVTNTRTFTAGFDPNTIDSHEIFNYLNVDDNTESVTFGEDQERTFFDIDGFGFGYTETSSVSFSGSGFLDLTTGAGMFSVAVVPEPSTWTMILAGFAGLCATGRHLRRAAA
jgi:hypothetical protein